MLIAGDGEGVPDSQAILQTILKRVMYEVPYIEPLGGERVWQTPQVKSVVHVQLVSFQGK